MSYTYPLDPDELPSEGVFEAVADAEDCSPLDLPPLAETADPDALDRLLADDATTDRIAFEYCNYAVSVDRDEITLQKLGSE